jgi:hypothetical protein
MKTWQKWVAGCAVFLLILTGFIVFILPGIVRSQAIKQVEAVTGRKFSVGKVSLNPFTWTAEVRDVRLSEKDGRATFVSFSSVRATVSPASIWRAAPVISKARITAPYIHLVRTAANTYNFSDLMEPKGPKKEKAGKPARFSLNNIVISNGSVDFIDRGIPVEKSHTVRRIDVGIPFISNIPYLAEKYILPSFSAVVNGAPLHAEGKMKPFAQAQEVSLEVELKNLDLPFYFAYVPGPIPVSIDSGRLTVKAEVAYRIAANAKPELNVTGKIGLSDLFLRDRTGEPLVTLKQGYLGIGKAGIMTREFAFSTLSIEGLEAFLSRDGKGAWNSDRLVGKGAPHEPDNGKKKESPEKKPLVSIAETRISGGTFHFADALPAGGFKTVVREITLDMKDFSTAEGKKAAYSFTFVTDREEKGKLVGDFSVTPLAVSTSLTFEGIPLEAYYPYIAGQLNGPLKGLLDFSGELSFADKLLSADKIAVRLRGLGADFGPKEGVRFTTASMEGGRYSQKENLLEVASVSIAGGDIRFSRDQEGSFSPLTLLRKPDGQMKKREGVVPTESKPFRYRMKDFAAKGLSVSFTDRKVGGDPSFTLRRIDLGLKNLTWPERESMPFRFGATYGDDASLKVSGKIRPAPFTFKGEATLRRIPLTDFDPYLPEDINIVLADGSLDTRLTFNLSTGKNGLAGDFKGALGVRNFYCLDSEHKEDLLKWESLQMDEISGALAPFSLSIKEVSLSKYFAKVVVNKDGTLNLQQLRTPAKKEGATEKAQPSPPPSTPSSPSPAAAQPGQPPAPQPKSVRIDTVTFQDGLIAFTDHHMSPEFATSMFNVGGRVSGLTSEEGKVATVDLRGNLENQSPLTITGSINPLRDDLFLDLQVKFSDIELSPVTPYSGRFLGYSIDKGKLFLDLKYHIEKKKLDSENKIFLDQFTLGRKVESDKATNLPVRLAVALLKDRKGEIHLNLPVTGRTDDPKFSVWGVVFQILRNLLVKAATSPFALLQGVFGGKDDFSAIYFAAGSSHLSDAEKEKLRKLAQVLLDRPALKLEVTGFVDREHDPEGYRNELLTKKMKSEKFLALVKEKKGIEGESSASVTIRPDEYSTYLKAVYKKEKFPKPRSIVGLVKDIPDPEMKKLILANTVVGEEDLKALARERATAVRTALVVEGKFPPERIFEKSGDIFKPSAKEGVAGSRVEFGVAVQ